jgi:hypothetical protein
MANDFTYIDLRRRFVDMALTYEGLGYVDKPPGRQEKYLTKAIYPFDTLAWAKVAGVKQSSCMLFVKARYAEAGCTYSKLSIPYAKTPGLAGTHLWQMGQAYNAWFDCSTRQGIEAYVGEGNVGGYNMGDMIWIGLEDAHGPVAAYGGHAHGELIVAMHSVELTDGRQVDISENIAGGQTDTVGYQILRRFRFPERVGNEIWVRDVAEVKDQPGTWKITGRGRRLWGVLDPTPILGAIEGLNDPITEEGEDLDGGPVAGSGEHG